MSLRTELRTVAGLARTRLLPTPEQAALRALQRRSELNPRRTRGRVDVLGLDLEYLDALTLVPQWHDIFVMESLNFDAAIDAPRIVDCGANVGLASLWFKRRFPRARITAFEADPIICDTLRRNLAVNGHGDVEVIHAAVWNANATISFQAEGTDSGALASVATHDIGQRITVPAIRLRDWIGSDTIDLLKLDIEGAEEAVLTDVAPVLGQVAALQLEVHEFSADHRLLPACLRVLENQGFHYALDELVPATWRLEGRRTGPFTRAVPAWVVLVRAWQRPR